MKKSTDLLPLLPTLARPTASLAELAGVAVECGLGSMTVEELLCAGRLLAAHRDALSEPKAQP